MAPVQLYVYDLSNGLARNVSFQWTGKQIDGIWHTSVVVFGKEIYYGPYNAGPGIQTTQPGRSHHGQPLKIENMGDTDIDEETFLEYIEEIQHQYTGEKYHLLDFNCNSFTNDCIGFLTGGSIPNWIKDLPADFLSTPFGQSMRPMIDNMFRRPLPGGQPAVSTAQPLPPFASASNAATLTSHVQMASNTSSFNTILKTNKAVVAFFTSNTCPPCKMIEPLFKELADKHARDGVAFVEVNISAMGSMIAQEWQIRATPTFLFFLNGKKMSDMKGANAPELRSQVEFLLYEAFPPHPHTKLHIPAVHKVSTAPILYNQPPKFDALSVKLISFIDGLSDLPDKDSVKADVSAAAIGLGTRFPASNDKTTPHRTLDQQTIGKLSKLTNSLLPRLKPTELFPVVDLWRMAVLDGHAATWISQSYSRPDGKETDVTGSILRLVQACIAKKDPGQVRNLLLTTLRLACNCFAHDDLARHVLTPAATTASPTPARETITALLVGALLHSDANVRTAAASLAFNVASFGHKRLNQNGAVQSLSEDGEWSVELLSALAEALNREGEDEKIVHRLVSALAFIIYMSPGYDDSISPLLEVLQVKNVLSKHLGSDHKYSEDLVKLIRDVILLCPESQ